MGEMKVYGSIIDLPLKQMREWAVRFSSIGSGYEAVSSASGQAPQADSQRYGNCLHPYQSGGPPCVALRHAVNPTLGARVVIVLFSLVLLNAICGPESEG